MAGHHCGSARAFAVNPSRLPAQPSGLRGLTAQRGQARRSAVPSMQNCARASLLTRGASYKPAFLNGRVCIETSTRFPPLSQQINRLPRQHDIAILAALGLLDTNDLLSAVDMLDLQPDHFAGTQAAP